MSQSKTRTIRSHTNHSILRFSSSTKMTEQEYKNVCAKIDAILADLGSEFSEDDPRIEQLLSLSDEADEYYKERHDKGYADIELTLEIQLVVKIIRMA